MPHSPDSLPDGAASVFPSGDRSAAGRPFDTVRSTGRASAVPAATPATAAPGAPGAHPFTDTDADAETGAGHDAADRYRTGPGGFEPPQPGFLAAVFRDLGADEAGPTAPTAAAPGGTTDRNDPAGDDPTAAGDDEVAAHGRAAALTHHRTLTVQAEHDHLADLLRRAALPVSAMDFESQLRHYEQRPFPADVDTEAGEGAAGTEPRWADYAPAAPVPASADDAPSRRLLDSSYQRELAQARLRHQRDLREWRTRRAESLTPELQAARRAHEEAEQSRARAVQEYNQSLEECRRAYRKAEPAAVESLLERALAAAEVATQDLPAPCRALYRPLTRTAVLDLDLPSPDVVPSLSGYRLAPDGSVDPVPRPPSERSSDYLRLAARLALRALQAADAVDTEEILAGAVLNGWLRRPGMEPVCLLSVDADRDALARTRLLPAAPDGRSGRKGHDGRVGPRIPGQRVPGWRADGDPRTGPSGPGGPGEQWTDAAGAEEPGDGVYVDAERDEALVRLRELAAVVTPDPYGPVPVEPNGTVGAAVPSAAELSPNEFSVLVRELLTRGGLGAWSVRLRGPAGLVATAEGGRGSALPGRWVVWASRGAEPVAADELRTLAEAVREEGAERGLRLTTGRFAEAALDLAAEEAFHRIHLVDGAGVQELSRTHLGLPLATGS
ncbi:restriction endonuclease [Kitasatospora sp. NPDC059571]|uniref:restriction endonuclease n=1 Tax=Kitasatospora sp. NPDC059571 TaxID=3346871 RepID=UPI0036C89D0B